MSQARAIWKYFCGNESYLLSQLPIDKTCEVGPAYIRACSAGGDVWMFHVYRVLWALAALTLVGFDANLFAQQATSKAPYTPPVGNLEMPSVTPEQAEQYLNARQMPKSDAVPPPVDRTMMSNQSLVKVNVEPVLGHDLPQGDTTRYGFKRADFATAKQGAADAADKLRKQALGSGVAVGSRPPSAVIQEQPPLIGSP